MSRRDEILQSSVGLFWANGLAGVGIDELGAAVGLSGPGLYRHFRGGKWAIVSAALDLAHGHVSEAFKKFDSDDAWERLENLVESYVRLAMRHSTLISLYFDIYLDSAQGLPEADRTRTLRKQRAYVARWAKAMRDARPDIRPTHAFTLVTMVLAMINSVSSRPSRQYDSGESEVLVALALNVLRNA